MTLKELTEKLRWCVRYSKADVELLKDLEVVFNDGTNELEYAFDLGRIETAKKFFRKNMHLVAELYANLTEEDKKKAYLYIYYNATEDPLLLIGLND